MSILGTTWRRICKNAADGRVTTLYGLTDQQYRLKKWPPGNTDFNADEIWIKTKSDV